MYEQEDLENALASLIKTRDTKKLPEYSRLDCGLCTNFFIELPRNYLESMFECWEHYSGEHNYPVPPTKTVQETPEYMYDNCYNFYDRCTKYGRLRWKLIDHCIEYMTNNNK